MYQKVSTGLHFVDRERGVEQYWQENHMLEKGVETRRKGTPYTFYDGPPTANGKPHIGHVPARIIKNLLPRYQTMRGKQAPREVGWGTRGPPVELEAEKPLHINDKDWIEAYGLEPFIDKCKESVWRYKGMQEDFSHTIGFWVDMNHPHITYDNNFIESEWQALKQIWEKELLYRDFKIVPHCPHYGTSLSSHGVAQGYKDVKERSAIVKFKVEGEDAYTLAWATTPRTLSSNVVLCVSPNERHVRVRRDDTAYYMAVKLVNIAPGEDTEILKSFVGTDLEYKEYEPLSPFVQLKEKCWFVTCDHYATLADDTGVVHAVPAFGEDDVRVGHVYSPPSAQLVNDKGQITKGTAWPGVSARGANPLILDDLGARGLLFTTSKFGYSYPLCRRCDTPLTYYVRES